MCTLETIVFKMLWVLIIILLACATLIMGEVLWKIALYGVC